MSVKTQPALARAVIRPVFLRALIAALFAVPTMFLHELGTDFLRYGTAALFVLTATQMWDYVKASRSQDPSSEAMAPGQVLAAVALLLGGVLMIFATSTFMGAVVAGITLVVAGAAEFYGWYKGRKAFAPARDLLISGLVQVVTGIALLVANQADVHSLLGIFAGGMTIIAIFWFIAALGFRHDARGRARSEAQTPLHS